MKDLIFAALISTLTACAHVPQPTRAECDAHTHWVDRIDGDWAVLMNMDGDSQDVSLQSLPESLREGEVLRGNRRDVQCTAILSTTTTAAL